MTSHTTPGSTTPAPSVAAISSPAPSTTSVAPSSPVASRSQARIGPSTAWARAHRAEPREVDAERRRTPLATTRGRAGRAAPVDDAFDGSTASSPDACHATHEPGSANTAAASIGVGLVPGEPRDLRRDVARVEVAAGQLAQPLGSARSRAAAHSSPARRSHQISAGRSGVPSAPRGHEAVELGAERQRRDLAPGGLPAHLGQRARRAPPSTRPGPARPSRRADS